MDSKQYNRDYWLREEPPPVNDTTTVARKRLLMKTLEKFLSTGDRKRILDAGCGAGEFVEFLTRQGFEVHGVDIADTAIQLARRRSPTMSLSVGSLEGGLPFASGTFDAVWCTEVLEHVFGVPQVLSEFNRVLRQNGLLILTTPYHGLFKNIAIVLLGFEKHFDIAGAHIRFFVKRSLSSALASTGFRASRWTGVGRAWPFYKSFFVVSQKVRVPGQQSQSRLRD